MNRSKVAEERAAVVAYLRKKADTAVILNPYYHLRRAADAIERGDHHAQAIEAGTAETGTGSVHESAVGTMRPETQGIQP